MIKGGALTVQLGFVFLIGIIFGSFLNVCIYRLPRKESIVWPGSHCPHCETSIPLWWNIPILSYIILAGQCRNCKVRIPAIYPVVEALTGFLLVLLFYRFGMTMSFLHFAVLFLLLLPISFIDLDTKLILNVLTFPGIAIGLVLSVVLKDISIWQSLFGLVLGGSFLWSVGLLGKSVFKKESMGGGDVKLGAMIGVFLGPKVLVALFLAFFLALPIIAIGLTTRKLTVGSSLPFGPFIALGTVIIVCYGQFLTEQYLVLLGRL
ncbi:MAG: prepilin peptidase [bacterium]